MNDEAPKPAVEPGGGYIVRVVGLNSGRTFAAIEYGSSAVDAAMAEGLAFGEFRKRLEPILRAKGWWVGGAGSWSTR